MALGTVRTASALGRPPGIALSSAVPLLQELPRDAVRLGGPLHQPVAGLCLPLQCMRTSHDVIKSLPCRLISRLSDSSAADAFQLMVQIGCWGLSRKPMQNGTLMGSAIC